MRDQGLRSRDTNSAGCLPLLLLSPAVDMRQVVGLHRCTAHGATRLIPTPGLLDPFATCVWRHPWFQEEVRALIYFSSVLMPLCTQAMAHLSLTIGTP